jgi:DNA-binding response OmpR family regulator
MSSVLRVLVISERGAEATALASALAGFDLDASGVAGEAAARAAASAKPFDAVVFDRLKSPEAGLSKLASDLKAGAEPRLLVTVAMGDALDPTRPPRGIDAALATPVHPAQIAARLKLMLRLAVMEDEARLRAATLAARGVTVDLGLDDAKRARVNVL